MGAANIAHHAAATAGQSGRRAILILPALLFVRELAGVLFVNGVIRQSPEKIENGINLVLDINQALVGAAIIWDRSAISLADPHMLGGFEEGIFERAERTLVCLACHSSGCSDACGKGSADAEDPDGMEMRERIPGSGKEDDAQEKQDGVDKSR